MLVVQAFKVHKAVFLNWQKVYSTHEHFGLVSLSRYGVCLLGRDTIVVVSVFAGSQRGGRDVSCPRFDAGEPRDSDPSFCRRL